MAKVVAPLQSFSASGQVGKSLVFFSHLGRNLVRGLVTPANPKTEGQGDNRLLLGALGRASKAIARPSDWFMDANQVTPQGQTWTSFFVKNAIALFGSGDTGVSALNTAYTSHIAKADFDSEAETRGLADVTISYAGSIKTLSAGAQLYALAAHTMALRGSNPALFNRAPYTTALSSWDSSEVTAFSADLVTVS